MFRKLASTVLAFRAVLMIGHGIVWLVVKQTSGDGAPVVGTVSSIISMVSITGGLLLLTFAFLGSRRGKADLAASNAALDASALSAGDEAFDADAVMERYLANKSAQSAAALENESAQPPVSPAPAFTPAPVAAAPLPQGARPVFGRKAA